ncbi:hypothetical protein LPJ53_004858 [Coemansia erecta]|uniref:Rab-GAP TBC domain-containing protein n=1 Tax=Coemansia erecta TaxID=147472 RepID=A0A9W8CQG6_9FUNG|nr:hypothetical protein LPJ53_004858 [Coemansia erecta]
MTDSASNSRASSESKRSSSSGSSSDGKRNSLSTFAATASDATGGRLQITTDADECVSLTLARVQVANDLLYTDPKRVVIEDGSVQALAPTLQSLADVRSPASPWPAGSDSGTAAGRQDKDGDDKDDKGDKGDKGGEDDEREQDSLARYAEGDERALPRYILQSGTVEELDAVTGAWAAALEGLADGEFWRALVDDAEGLRRRAPLHLAAKVRAGVPGPIRGAVWRALTQAQSTYLQTLYAQLVQEPSAHERVIRRDLPRTFPRIPVFRRLDGSGQARLFRILKAYSLYDAEVGYCQGLGFIIGPLMLSMDECQAFCVLVRLMETYGLRGMFTEDMAGLHLRLWQFAELAREIAPGVMAHLDGLGVVPAMYAPAWFLSLFAYTMPLSFVLRTLDVVAAEGAAPETIVRIGVALLQRNAEEILAQEDFESAMAVLNTRLYDDAGRARDRPGFVLQDAARLQAVVTAERLDALEAQYRREQRGSPDGGRQAAAAAAARAEPSRARFLGWPWGGRSGSGGGAAAAAASDAASSASPLSSLSSPSPSSSASASASASCGRISPRVLELTEAQRARSQQLREQMLRTLQTQDDAPATVLGTVAALSGRTPPAAAAATASASPSPASSEEPAQCLSPVGRSSDSAWRDAVLEPLERQLHDARVTCDTHRDALIALQAEHESLRRDLALAKAERAQLAEANERLANELRLAEGAKARARMEQGAAEERAARVHGDLAAVRGELAEADEERALLVRQLSNLRRFIAAEGAEMERAGAGAGGRREEVRQRLLSMDEPPQAAAKQQQQQQPSRFSISSIASNWSAIREAITSPRQSAQLDEPQPLVVSVVRSDSSSGSSSNAPLSPAPSTASASASTGAARSSAIPLAALHRSKTIATASPAAHVRARSPPVVP